jgi:mannose-6-phosphate isomerase-like protein (cupin superfamily)
MSDLERFVIRASDTSDAGHAEGASFRLVQRDQLGLGEISVGLSDNPPGSSAARAMMHRHSCGEVFVVYQGRGVYTIEDEEIVAGPGDMVIVPPNTWHTFRQDGESRLRHVAVYDTGTVDIELSGGGGVSQM